MRYTLWCLLFSVLLSTAAHAQQDTIAWINKHAHELEDLSFLQQELAGRPFVALGEASHGTEEFYRHKARIIKFLVEHQQFRRLSFEFAASAMKPVNAYVQSGQGNLKELMKGFALYNTMEIYELFTWIRQYNEGKPAGERVEINGVDHEDFWADPFQRDKWMAANVVSDYDTQHRKTIIWAHNVHLIKDTAAQYQSMGAHLFRRFGDSLYVMCTDTYSGTVNVINNGEFEAHTFTANAGLLVGARPGAFFLSLKAGNSPLNGITLPVVMIYSNWQGVKHLPVRAGIDADAILFIRHTRASEKLR